MNMLIFVDKVEVKKTVPKENMQVKGASKTKKIFIGGLPLPLTEGKSILHDITPYLCESKKLLL